MQSFNTQYVKVSPAFDTLPPFLKQKLQESLIREVQKKQMTKEQLEEKIAKARKAKQEKSDLKFAKVVLHNQKVDEHKTTTEMKFVNKAQERVENYHRKAFLGEMRANKFKNERKLKAQMMGTIKVQMVQLEKADIEIHSLQRSKSVKVYDAKLEKVSAQLQQIVQKNSKKNYQILKNINTKRFNERMQLANKKKSMEQKLAASEARRNDLLNQRISKAKHLAHLRVPKMAVIEENEPKRDHNQSVALEKPRRLSGESVSERHTQTSNHSISPQQDRRSVVMKRTATAWILPNENNKFKNAYESDWEFL